MFLSLLLVLLQAFAPAHVMPLWCLRVQVALEVAERTSDHPPPLTTSIVFNWVVTREDARLWFSTAKTDVHDGPTREINYSATGENAFHFIARRDPSFVPMLAKGLQAAKTNEQRNWFIMALGVCGRSAIDQLDEIAAESAHIRDCRRVATNWTLWILQDSSRRQRSEPLLAMLRSPERPIRTLAITLLQDLRGDVETSPKLIESLLAVSRDGIDSEQALALYAADAPFAVETLLRRLCEVHPVDLSECVNAMLTRVNHTSPANLKLLCRIFVLPCMDARTRRMIAAGSHQAGLGDAIRDQADWIAIPEAEREHLRRILDSGQP